MELRASPNLLVVEDDEDDFLLVQDLLRSELAARGQQACSVEQALQSIERAEFDAILLDYSLGARNGLELLQELRARDSSPPVIFLTGHGGEEIAVRALKGGAVDYLSKSRLNAETLGAAVRHALALREKDSAVRQARAELSARERESRSLFEKANDAILIMDPQSEVILEANPAACRVYACEHGRLVGQSLLDFSTDIERGHAAVEEVLRAGEITNFETVHVSREGRRLHLLVNASVIEYRGRQAILSVCRDISERKAAEQEIFRLNRALKALSKGNAALLHAREQQPFLDEICEIVVQTGGYRMAWVAAAPVNAQEAIAPLASAGAAGRYLDTICRRYAPMEDSSLLVPTAMRSGAPAVCRDTSTLPEPKRGECAAHGFASILALPLQVERRCFGALAIYSGEPDAFDDEEVALLQELAANVGYGLESIAARREREAAQNELRASEKRLRNLIETANEGIWTIDIDDRTSFVNATMAEMLGLSPEQMLGRNVIEFLDPSQYSAFEQSIEERRAMSRGRYESILVRADGSRIVTSLNSSPILDANGEYGGALAMVSDITEQKRAEERLRESEQRYRTLFERNLAGVFRAGAEGVVLEGNEAFLHMLGYQSIADLQPLPLPDLCAAAGCTDRWLERLRQEGQLVNQELCVLRQDGETAYLLANLVALRNPAGELEFIEGTVLDITQRRQLEAQLLQAQKMEAIGQLAGGIAHDFNNLLMVIRSYAEMAVETVADEKLREDFESIIKAADRGAALTRQLLTFGRKQVLAPRLTDVNAVLENMTKVLPRALGEDICVELRAVSELWPVKVDPVQLEQLVLNLAVNARDAMPEGGRLTLETSNCVLGSDYVRLHAGVEPGEYVMLAVSDTGHGIPPELLPRIFEPFFTTKERGKGTGLGLATVYGIAQQSGGFVWVYSEVGHGTVFKVYLPRATEVGVSAAPGRPAGEGARTGTETILLVEDEEAVRETAADYLARRGYRVLSAASGEEALRLCDSHTGPLHLLITDAVMPGMSGMVLAEKITGLCPGIRVLYISGYTEAAMAAHGIFDPAAFLQKPFSLAALAEKARDVLDSGRDRSGGAPRQQSVA